MYVAIALVRLLRSGRAGHLDARAQPVVRRVHLHVFAHSRRVPDRSRHRQQHRVDRRQDRRTPAHRTRLVPAAERRRDGVERLHADGVAAVLAHQHVDHDQHLVQLPARFRARLLGRAARARFCGARAFRSRSRRSRDEGEDPGRLVGGVYAANTVGAIFGSVDREPDSRLLVRIAARAAGADDRVGHVRPAPARAGRTELDGARCGPDTGRCDGWLR